MQKLVVDTNKMVPSPTFWTSSTFESFILTAVAILTSFTVVKTPTSFLPAFHHGMNVFPFPSPFSRNFFYSWDLCLILLQF